MKQKGNNIFNVEELSKENLCNSKEIGNRWVPARPYRCDNIFTRLKNAFKVFRGDYDLVKWDGQ